jgi:hypothetical protein
LYSSVVVISIVSFTNGQSNSTFAAGEGTRVYDLLDALGCIGGAACQLSNFTPTTACDYKPPYMACNANGRLLRLYGDDVSIFDVFFLRLKHNSLLCT